MKEFLIPDEARLKVDGRVPGQPGVSERLSQAPFDDRPPHDGLFLPSFQCYGQVY